MLVDKTPADLTRVNLEDAMEVRYWCARFNIGPDELRTCVLAVGPHVDDVEQRLKAAARSAFEKTGED
jgi:hypothetical protein